MKKQILLQESRSLPLRRSNRHQGRRRYHLHINQKKHLERREKYHHHRNQRTFQKKKERKLPQERRDWERSKKRRKSKILIPLQVLKKKFHKARFYLL